MVLGGESSGRNYVSYLTEMKRLEILTPPPSISSSLNPLGDSLQPILPFEIMEEILCRLPVKSLAQFCCVCKSWNSLISDRKFTKKHLYRSSMNPTRHRLIFSPSRFLHFVRTSFPHAFISNHVTEDTVRLDHPLNNPYSDSIIVGSCDGILCITINPHDIVLWNPSIQKSKKLPTLEEPSYIRDYFNHTVYGFGYDHVADNYKVIAVSPYVCEAKIHTLGTDSWRRINNFPYFSSEESGKLVSSTLNWFSGVSLNIISFDLVKECCQELSPPDYGGKHVIVTLGVLRDCLCIFSYGFTFSEIWIMNEYGNKDSWTKLFSVPDSFDLCTRVLYFYEDDEVVLEYNSNLTIYNYRNGASRSPDTEYNTRILEWMVPQRYIESLVSPCP
ncbi:F-box/kelch-repeat protein At3g23880-like [Lotus japonicus]|uniref:F-box/kelch-repeat protein At3g23880-like n=1 Tax=Lotus japonicus TaxID=34305 RepID=UPI00258A2225|nr:F-box/kelch-repeat protein At3g23880-like [Lotus japonicus]